eukprot:TRINITY_DN5217_c0_g1_i2.p1 TRINITY_DN5217_c0_g1~~TRINITY_DN5217_c0_g1_i2.p1  ORF type:complete len:612 (-),score=191.64 TRINITY_DN5217_c0_g1_i2:37-1872(-)
MTDITQFVSHGGEATPSFKKKVFDALLLIEDLLDYCHLNAVGCTKILKKFERHTTFPDREVVAEQIKSLNFISQMPALEKAKVIAKQCYTTAVKTGGAKGDKEMEELEQSVLAARSWKLNTILFQFDEHLGKAQLKKRTFHIKQLPLVVAVIVAMIVYFTPIFPEDKQPEQRCLALLAVAIVLWVSEAFPLFLTGIFIPFLVTVSWCVYVSGTNNVMIPSKAASFSLNAMWSSIIFLMLGGFSIAEGLKKYGIDKRIAVFVLHKKIFNTPLRFLFVLEVLCVVLSMWISNVAGPVICMTVSLPIIRDLPPHSQFAKTILLAIAVAGNMGGMTTPISSPQNAVAIQTVMALDPPQSINFAMFVIIQVPLVILLTIIGHFIVTLLYKPDIQQLPQMHADTSGPIPTKGYFVLLAACASIILWFCSQWLEAYTGSIGILSVIPIMLFFGTGLLGKAEFDNLPWTLMMLVGGGSVLGKAVQESKLLQLISDTVTTNIPTSNVYIMLVVFNVLMLIVSTFVSHTVSALILLPLFANVGAELGSPRTFVMCGVAVCCGTMVLPISSFPNLNSISLQDERGDPYLATTDFLKLGSIMSLLCFIGSITLTYGLCYIFGY